MGNNSPQIEKQANTRHLMQGNLVWERATGANCTSAETKG